MLLTKIEFGWQGFTSIIPANVMTKTHRKGAEHGVTPNGIGTPR